jgi:alpha-glucosidase (family GH31 glycosyl hydrolase)
MVSLLFVGVSVLSSIAVATAHTAVASVCDGVSPHLSFGLGYGTAAKCQAAGGCWEDAGCYFPKVNGYEFQKNALQSSSRSTKGNLTLISPSGALGPDYTHLNLNIEQETNTRMHIKIFPDEDRWEVPESVFPRPTAAADNDVRSDMNVFIPKNPPFELIVNRGKQPIFILSKMLIYQDQYMQVVLALPKGVRSTYGFGESTRTQQALQVNTSRTLWATDYGACNFDSSLYGSHPFYIQVMEDGTAHGVFLLNSNAMEATLFNDPSMGDSIAIQTNGGVFDFYVFSGPTPKEVLQQYFDVIGKPALVPYWSLGFHNCRWGYESVDYVSEVVANYSAAGIPLETQWMDIDYMNKYLDFTTDPVDFPLDKMKAFVEGLHANGQHFVPIVDPGIYAGPIDNVADYPALADGLEKNVFIMDYTGETPVLGQVWPGATYYPDWFAANITEYWTGQHVDFHNLVSFDGIWIDMNEVSNFCNAKGDAQVCKLDADSTCPDGCCLACSVVDPNNKHDFAPYTPHVAQGAMAAKTIAMSATHAGGVKEFDAHSLYGLMESIETRKAVITATGGKRPFVLSRSTFASSGHHVAHWTGDNAATWADLSASIITMNNLALFGLSMTGADICGFAHDTNEELCARWIEVGAFSPFSRDHTEIDSISQELYRWDTVAEASRKALSKRYQLLPHLYTLMYEASAQGITVMNGMWVNYPTDATAFTVDGQYMWGNTLLFTPVLVEGATTVKGYFPKGTWYSLFDENAAAIQSTNDAGTWAEFDTPLTETNIHIRAGSVIPMQDAAMTVAAASVTPFTLFVALDDHQRASGTIYRDDLGANATYTRFAYSKIAVARNTITSSYVSSSDKDASTISVGLGKIVVRGLAPSSASCTARSGTTSLPASYNKDTDRLTIDASAAKVSPYDFTIQFHC